MFGYLILLFTLLPALELIVLIEVGGIIGSANTILIIILTGVMGAYLARLQGFFIFQKIQQNLNQGTMPTEEMLDGLMVLVGGIVLLTPGFITDTLGFLLLIPFTRAILKQLIQRQFERMVTQGRVKTYSSTPFENRLKDTNLGDDVEDADFR